MKQHQYDPEVRKLISLNNYEELHRHLLRLSWRQQVALQLRFWERYSIYQVAYTLGISWRAADELIESAICNLKFGLMESATKSVVNQAA